LSNWEMQKYAKHLEHSSALASCHVLELGA
jgi:hypothetical protein